MLGRSFAHRKVVPVSQRARFSFGMGCRGPCAICLLVTSAIAQQAADPEFKTTVEKPTYVDKHPRVLFDTAHHNFHTPDGRYRPFADLITSDGCHVTSNKNKFSKEALKDCDVLIIANALGAPQLNDADAGKPAFTDEECDAVRDWVRDGGALLLITDHHPIGAAAESLGKRLGVAMSKGSTVDEPPFTRDDGTLSDHAITRGRSSAEVVNRVRTFTGQTLDGPDGSVALLKTPSGMKEKFQAEGAAGGAPKTSNARGRAMAIALELGKGRAVICGEAAMLTAQVAGTKKFGMNAPDCDNRQFALNIMHWLTGELK